MEEEIEAWLGVLAKLSLVLCLVPKSVVFVHEPIWLPSRTKTREREVKQYPWALDIRREVKTR